MASEKKIEIRLASPKDIVNIGKILEDADQRMLSGHAPVDDVRMYEWILGIISRGIVAVADLSGRVVGAIGASAYQPGWSRVWVMDVDFFYVLPKFRDARIDDELLSIVEGWCDRKTADMGLEVPLTLTLTTGDRAAAKDRKMAMRGYQYLGGQFARRPKDGRQQEEHLDDQERDSGLA